VLCFPVAFAAALGTSTHRLRRLGLHELAAAVTKVAGG
jgi:hypothetical protein